MKTELPHRGCLAICSNGSLGIITSHTKISIPMDDQPDYHAWSGIQVSPSLKAKETLGRVVGDTWCSSSPTVVLTAKELRCLANRVLTERNNNKAKRLIEAVRKLNSPDSIVKFKRVGFENIHQ